MSLQAQFDTAAQEVQKLSKRPDNDTLLKLYAFFKQAKEGDVTGSRPGMLDIAGRKKFDAWTALKGMQRDKAMESYVALVNQLKTSQG